MKRKTIITISIICAVLFLIINYFIIEWYNNTHTGTRSGKVIDAITGKPIQGAVVKCSWEFSVFMGGAVGGNSHISREVSTDEQGQYYIPSIYAQLLYV